MSDPKNMGDLMNPFLAWQREETERMRDPEYARRVEEREAALVAEREQRERDERAAVARRRRERLIERGVPAKDVDAALAGTLLDTPALVRAREWLASDQRLLVLAGARGVGKTTAAAWLAVQVDGARVLDAPRLMRVDTYSDDAMVPLETCPLLVLDDMGTEYADAKGKLASAVDGLVNVRYAALLRTVITTNLNAEQFKARYGERVADRIREVGRFVELGGPSLRSGKKGGE